ncbi:DmpA family aminopeptidase [Falsiroseomonas oryziterrae]|uniref:DmpA family aminopeptidase n=1 Tax=Falsiroseomonas oryziterrae TaxID=2911368 RepID=UPI001F3C19C0|nr:P1 family peptidase [Roseomonas sp. NPKOSM-4]
MSGRCRARDLGFAPGILPPGPLNAITDVAGLRVGQVTVIAGESTRTGVTAILPHGENPFAHRVPAGLFAMNGFGKMAGVTQVLELGELETPILLTNTLAVGRAVEALVDWTLAQPGNEAVRSVNAVVGETNDGRLNDIRTRGVSTAEMREALEIAAPGPVAEGSVGAGTGTMAFGWKGGIGTASRVLPPSLGGWTVGALVQANYGGALTMCGLEVGKLLGKYYLADHLAQQADADGSVVVVVATDAPLSDRNLQRLARRAMAGIARTGAAFSDGSGDYAIAFATHPDVIRTPQRRAAAATLADWPNERMSPLFVAAAETTEEAVLNALTMATTVESRIGGRRVVGAALPLDRVMALRNGG